MAKIPGWTFIGDGNIPGREIWERDWNPDDIYAPMAIFVGRFTHHPDTNKFPNGEGWSAVISARKPSDLRGLKKEGVNYTIKRSTDKKKVRASAIKWMRSHPRG